MAVTDAMGGQIIEMSSKKDKVSFIIAKQKNKHGVYQNGCKQKHSAGKPSENALRETRMSCSAAGAAS